MKLSTIKNRLREPSTYAGLAALGTVFGIKELVAFGAPEVAVIAAALAAIFLPEKDRSVTTQGPSDPNTREP